HIETTELPNGPGDCLPAERRLSHVAAEEKAARVVLLYERLRFRRIVVLVEVRDRDVCPFFREGDRHRATDAAIAPGDEDDSAPEPSDLPALGLGLRAR